MEFNGLKIYPVGNAKLSIENNVLRVSEISDSGLDGILIDTNGNDNYTVNFGNLGMISENNGVLKTSTLKRNKLGQVVTSFETFKWFDEKNNKIVLGYNLDYLPKEFTVFGKLEGKKIFDINSSDLCPVNLNSKSTREVVTVVVTIIIGVATIGVAIWGALRTKKTTTTVTIRDNNGNVTGTATAVSEDPIPFEIEINNRVYTIDEYGIDFSKQIPDNLIGNPAMEYNIIGEQITGTNLSEFEITSIGIEKN